MMTLLFSHLAFQGRKAVEENVDDGACMKQVLDGTQHGAVLLPNSLLGLTY
jgi:hypothetical protein